MVIGTKNPEHAIRDTLPHEVDHIVRNSLVRHPIARWLDEGAATLAEGRPKYSLRNRARLAKVQITASWLDQMEYPPQSDNAATSDLYAVGFVLVEHLVEEHGPERLLHFTADQRRPSQKLQEWYGITPAGLSRWFADWQRTDYEDAPQKPDAIAQAQTVNCPPGHDGRNTLVVWSAGWCAGCRKFWQDYNADPAFKAELHRRFDAVVKADYDRWRACALRQGITHIPTFVVGPVRVVGYSDEKHPNIKAWLLESLPDPTRKPQPNPVPVPKHDGFLPDLPDAPEPPATPPAPADQVEADGAVSVVTPPDRDQKPGPPPERPQQQPASRKPWLDVIATGVGFAVQYWPEAALIGTGGIGTAALFGLRTWMAIRKRRREPQMAVNSQPATKQSCPPTQQIVRGDTEYVPYETDSFYKAYEWANDQLVRHSPGVVDTIEAQKAKIQQHLSGQVTGRNLQAIMWHADSRVSTPPSINTLTRIHKLCTRARSILAARAVPSGTPNMESAHAVPAPEQFLVYPTPYFKVRNQWLKQYAGLILLSLTEAMQHQENARPIEISTNFAGQFGQYIQRVYRTMATELFRVPLEEASAPDFTLTEDQLASYNPSAWFTSTEMIDTVPDLANWPTEDQLELLTNGIP
ncbi:Uncharacterized protein (Fragment), partial [Durusdinium trenchii]